jgi:hypothetical protein
MPEPLLMPEPEATPQTLPRRRRRPWRAAALLLLGSAIGAAAVLATSTNPSESQYSLETKYLTVLPPAAPAAPPPQIIYVDKWRIVSPDPQLLPHYDVFAPAMPIEPPPQIVIVERTAKTVAVPSAKPKKPDRTAPPQEMKPQAPEPRPQPEDVAKEIERWLSRSPTHR